MIITEADADTVSTTRTLTPSQPKIPPHFLALITLSSTLSFIALVTTLLALGHFDPAHTVPTIFAFSLALFYHIAAYLFAWLHAHEMTAIMPLAPASPRGVAYASFLIMLWALAAGFNLSRVVLSLSPARDRCFSAVFNGVSYEPCSMYYPRGIKQVPIIMAAASTVVEMLVSGVIVALCEAHRRRSLSSERDEGASSTLESAKSGT